MKKIYQFTIACLVMCTLAACGGSNESSNLSSNINYGDDFESLHKALAEKKQELFDFPKNNELRKYPPKVLGIPFGKEDWSNLYKYSAMLNEYTDAVFNIYTKELRFLIEQNEPTSTTRAKVVLSEFEQELNFLQSLSENEELSYGKVGSTLSDNILNQLPGFLNGIKDFAQIVDNTEFLEYFLAKYGDYIE